MRQKTASRSAKRFVATLLAIPLCALLPLTAHAKDEPTPVVLDASFKAADQASKLMTVTESKALKGVKKVAVPLFSVEFVIADAQRAETSGFAAAGRASSTLAYTLKGMDPTDFQAITAGLYERFVADLKATGVEVLTPEQLGASPAYKKLAASGVASPILSSSAITAAPAGLPIYGFNKTQTGGTSSGASLFGALSQMGSSFGAVGAILDTATMQQELNAHVIEVQMKVNFVQLTNNNKGFLGRLSSTASVDGKVQPSVGSASFRVYGGSTGGSVTLAAPLALDGAAFSEVRKKESSTGEKVGLVAVAVLGAMIGGGGSSSRDDMEAVADPAKYRDIVGKGLGVVTQMFVQRLKAGE